MVTMDGQRAKGNWLVETLRALLGTFWDHLAPFILLFVPAGLARLIWHYNQVQEGRRDFWSWHLLFEFAVAAFSMYVGAGIAEWFEAGPRATLAVVGMAGWFGPKGTEALILLALKRAAPKPKT